MRCFYHFLWHLLFVWTQDISCFFFLFIFISFVNMHPFYTGEKKFETFKLVPFMLSFLLKTLEKHSGIEDLKQWNVSVVILSHSSCRQSFRCTTVGHRCHIFYFKILHTFSIKGVAGGGSREASPVPASASSSAFMCAECGFALSCWKIHGYARTKMLPWGHVALKSQFPQVLNVHFCINQGSDTTP